MKALPVLNDGGQKPPTDAPLPQGGAKAHGSRATGAHAPERPRDSAGRGAERGDRPQSGGWGEGQPAATPPPQPRGKLFIQTHGCQMNEYDSAKMADVLAASDGLELTDDVS